MGELAAAVDSDEIEARGIRCPEADERTDHRGEKYRHRGQKDRRARWFARAGCPDHDVRDRADRDDRNAVCDHGDLERDFLDARQEQNESRQGQGQSVSPGEAEECFKHGDAYVGQIKPWTIAYELHEHIERGRHGSTGQRADPGENGVGADPPQGDDDPSANQAGRPGGQRAQ